PPHESVPLAKQALAKALALDDSLGEAHASLGNLLVLHERDFAGAETEFRKAVRLAPNDAMVRQWHSRFFLWRGRFAEAREEVLRARDADPTSPLVAASIGAVSYYERSWDRAIRELRQASAQWPDFALSRWLLADAEERKGLYAEALADYRAAMSVGGGA